MTRDELIECTALLAAVHAGRLDTIQLPELPLDIAAQQVVAEVGAQEWRTDDLFALVQRAAPFHQMTREQFDEVIDLVSNGIATGRGPRGAYVHHDAINGELRGRKGAASRRGHLGRCDPRDRRLPGASPNPTTRSSAPSTKTGRSSRWRATSSCSARTRGRSARSSSGVVRVRDAGTAPPTIPFWMGEAPARTAELSTEVSNLRAAIDRFLTAGDPDGAKQWLMDTAGIDAESATMVVDYLAVGRAVLGAMPTQERIVFERFFDETGGMQLVVHSPFGGRVNRSLGLALRKKFCRTFNFELQAAASDDAIVLSLGPHHSFPLSEVPGYLSSATVEDTLEHAILDSPMFQARWRWNLNRSLMVLRFRGGRRNPPPIQRMESDDLMAAVFPQAAACQENVTGPIEIPDHVLVRQTISDTLHEALDVVGTRALLERMEAGTVQVHFADTTEPSVLAHEILTARPYAFLDDEELQNRRTNAVTLRRGLSVDLAAIGALDPAAIEQVHGEITPEPETGRRPRRPAGVAGDRATRVPTWQALFDELAARGRAVVFRPRDTDLWCAAEREDDAGHAFADDEEAIAQLLRGHLEISGITTVDALAEATTLTPGRVTAGLAYLEQSGFALQGTYTAGRGRHRVGVAPACWRGCTPTPVARAVAASSPPPPKTSCASCCGGSTSRRARSWPARSDSLTRGRAAAGLRRRRGGVGTRPAGRAAAAVRPRLARPALSRR